MKNNCKNCKYDDICYKRRIIGTESEYKKLNLNFCLGFKRKCGKYRWAM
jgi:hypothetical protein